MKLLILILISGLLACLPVYAGDDEDDDNYSEINFPPQGVSVISGIAEQGESFLDSASGVYADDDGYWFFNSLPEGLPVISGLVVLGQVLIVDTSNITDADGLGDFSYRWLRDGRTIKGKKAKKTTYVLIDKDLNTRISVLVKYKDGGGTKESVLSAETAKVVKVNVPGAVSISGDATQGKLLTANVSDADGFVAAGVSYQWHSGGIDIAGAIASTYALTQVEVNKSVSVTVSYIDGGGEFESVSSATLGPVVNVNDLGVVTVTGDAIDGSVLTVTDITDADGLSSSNFSYQWLRDGAVIGNASDSYTVVTGDIGAFFSVVVSYSDDLGAAEVVTSNVVGAIRPDLPRVNAPPALGPISATGWFTPVTLDPGFAATAFDTLDNSSLTATTDSRGQLRPGINTVTWAATDSAGNVGTATQTVSVVPLVEVSKVQRIAEGSSAGFTISLNGDALQYPVSVPYTVSGTADVGDHNLISATAVINAPAPGETPEVIIPFATIADGQQEGTESIIITLGVPVNAVLGLDSVHTIEIVEDNVPPLVRLEATQLQVDASSGSVTVFAIASDANDGDSLSYNWSGTDNAIANANGTSGGALSFSANTLSPGFYTLHVDVDDGIEAASGTLLLNVVSSLPALDAALDSDADGIKDNVEGYTDADGDGVADYLDAVAADHVIQIRPGVSNAFIMQTQPGLKLSLGEVAIKAAQGGSLVTQEDVSSYSFDEGEESIDTFGNVGGYFDFTVTGLPVTGQSIQIVIPQIAAMPRASVYRKLVSSTWQDYVQDASNSVASAAGEEGYCPPPGDPAYTAGLNEGHWCLQLTIEDGGPNDSDSVANNRLTDPGGVGRVLSSVSVGSGGSLHPLVLILGIFTILALRRNNTW